MLPASCWLTSHRCPTFFCPSCIIFLARAGYSLGLPPFAPFHGVLAVTRVRVLGWVALNALCVALRGAIALAFLRCLGTPLPPPFHLRTQWSSRYFMRFGGIHLGRCLLHTSLSNSQVTSKWASGARCLRAAPPRLTSPGALLFSGVAWFAGCGVLPWGEHQGCVPFARHSSVQGMPYHPSTPFHQTFFHIDICILFSRHTFPSCTLSPTYFFPFSFTSFSFHWCNVARAFSSLHSRQLTCPYSCTAFLHLPSSLFLPLFFSRVCPLLSPPLSPIIHLLALSPLTSEPLLSHFLFGGTCLRFHFTPFRCLNLFCRPFC